MASTREVFPTPRLRPETTISTGPDYLAPACHRSDFSHRPDANADISCLYWHSSMLSKTTISALRALIYLARQGDRSCMSPRRIAEALDESPTYLAKSLRHLVKKGILRAEKGVHCGVRLGKQPTDVTLLSIVEACQGAIVSEFWQPSRQSPSYCGFRRATLDLHDAITGVLSRWTLARFLEASPDDPDVRRGQPS